MDIQDILDLKGSEVITVLPSASLRDITVILADRGIGTVMVTDSGGNLVGIVSERDIVRCIAEQGEISFALRAGDLMTTDLITCTPETSITDALAPMSRHGIRHLPVVVDDAVLGLISIRDVLNHRAQSLESDIVALTQAAAEVRLAKEEAEISDRAKTEFLANMSHELKTPLNAVIGFSELMAAEAFGPIGTPKYKAYAEEIRDSGRHLVDIVNDILDVSRLEANTVEADDNDIHIEDAIASGLRLVADRARESEISLSVALPPDLPVLVADTRMFKQMISNLLTNAVKFTPRGGAVYVTGMHAADTGIDIAVRDSGCGISADMLDKVTRPFHQADASINRKHEGTGLGLALVNSMMLLHGGKLVLESELSAGTTATLRFPAERASGNRHGLPAEAADMPPRQAAVRAV